MLFRTAASIKLYVYADSFTLRLSRKRIWRNKENQKSKTLDLNESLESEAFVDELEEAVKSKKNKEKKVHQKNISQWTVADTKTTAQPVWGIRKATSSISIWNVGKAAAERGCRKTKEQRVVFTIWQNVRTG